MKNKYIIGLLIILMILLIGFSYIFGYVHGVKDCRDKAEDCTNRCFTADCFRTCFFYKYHQDYRILKMPSLAKSG